MNRIRRGKTAGKLKHLGKSVGCSRIRNLKRIANKQISKSGNMVKGTGIYETVFIHYGSNEYKPELTKPLSNYYNKPAPGTCLWACPVNSNDSWYQWCEKNEFDHTDFTKKFYLKIKENNRGLIIDSQKDMNDFLPLVNMETEIVDFERLNSNGIDYIWLTEKGRYETHLSYPRNLYGWDCESLLVLNPHSIYQLDYNE